MELLILFGFLTGWFVCWIQMSKSESRKVEQLQFENQKLRLKTQKDQQFAQERALALDWDLQ
jgi:hypothetical protein